MNMTLAKFIAARPGGFITKADLPELLKLDPHTPLLVRCNYGRFTCPAQNAAHYMRCAELGGDYVRDVCVPTNVYTAAQAMTGQPPKDSAHCCKQCGKPYTICPKCGCHWCSDYWSYCPRCNGSGPELIKNSSGHSGAGAILNAPSTDLAADNARLRDVLAELATRCQIMLDYATSGRTETRWTGKDGIAPAGSLANHDALQGVVNQASAALRGGRQ